MDKRLFQIGSVILGAILMGSCARGIVAPPGLSSKLLDIKLDNTDTATVITLKTNNLPQYASFTTKSPPAITVDLASTDASNVSGSMSVDNGFVKKISVNQLGESTGYSSRIIITLEKPLAYQTSADGNNIIINVSKSEEQKTVLPSEGLQLTTPTPSVGAEMSPSVSPEALAPIGMEASPTTLPLTPPAGAEMSPSVSPEALAPIGMEASPTTTPEAPQIVSSKEVSLPEAVSSSQGITEESMQTNVVSAVPPSPQPAAPVQAPPPPVPSPAPSVSSVPPTVAPAPVVVSTPSEKKHEKKEKIAMLVPSTPAVPEIKRLKIVHDTIVTPVPLVFKNNEAVLSKDAEEGLKDVADYILQHKDVKVVIQGYSDAYGSESYNKELSYYRTLWVKMALERYGVPSNRLIMKPMGATKKFGHTKATYAQNRRVVLKLVK